MIKFNEVTWYSKLAAIIFFLGVFPILTFYIGMQYQEVKTLDQSEKSVSISNEKSRESSLVGVWVHRYPESTIPFDSDSMEFLIKNGIREYISYLHNEPDFTGGCVWKLDFDVVKISCPEDKRVDEFHIISLDEETLVVQHASSIPVVFERSQN